MTRWPEMTRSIGLGAVRPEYGGAVPLARQQGEFDVETVLLEGGAPPRDRPADPVLHGIEVQVEFFGRLFVARPAAKEDPQRLAQAGIAVGVRRQFAKYVGHPYPGRADVAAEQRSGRQSWVRRRDDGRRLRPTSHRNAARRLCLAMRPAKSVDAGRNRADRDVRRICSRPGELAHRLDAVRRRTVGEPPPSGGFVGGREQWVRADVGGLAELTKEALQPSELVTGSTLVRVPDHDGEVVPQQRIA